MSLVQVASFATAPEAEYTSNYLKGQGVPAFVDGATAGTVLSHIGSALGGIRVLVDEVNADKAAQLLTELNESAGDDGEPWFCGVCQEEVDGSFAACWSCGRSKDDVAADSVPKPEPPAVDTVELPKPIQTNNPYQPPIEGTVEAPVPETNQQANELLDRAWKAIILGTVFLPFIMQPYGLYLLYQSTKVTHDFSPELNRKFYRVLVAGILSCVAWLAFLRSFFR